MEAGGAAYLICNGGGFGKDCKQLRGLGEGGDVVEGSGVL